MRRRGNEERTGAVKGGAKEGKKDYGREGQRKESEGEVSKAGKEEKLERRNPRKRILGNARKGRGEKE